MKRILRLLSLIISLIVPLSLIIWLLSRDIGVFDCKSKIAGYDLLKLYLANWEVYRNYTYVAFTFVIIVIGVWKMIGKLIMRFLSAVGCDLPKVNISISDFIPAIILSLVLTTFSYTIAGLYIDIWNIVNCLF